MGYGEESRFHRKNGFDQANISVAAPILLARGVKSGWNTWTSLELISKKRTSSCRPAFERQVLILKISFSSRYHVFLPNGLVKDYFLSCRNAQFGKNVNVYLISSLILLYESSTPTSKELSSPIFQSLTVSL